MVDADDRPESRTEQVEESPLTWWVPTSVFAAAVAYATPHVPPRLRLLVLFPVACGLVIGWVSGRLADAYLRRSRVLLVAVTFVVATAGVARGTLLAYEGWAEAARAELRRDLDRQLEEAGESSLLPAVVEKDDGAFKEATSFEAYLTRRIARLGAWPVAGAFAFWIAECLLAGVAASAVAWRCVTATGPLDTHEEKATES